MAEVLEKLFPIFLAFGVAVVCRTTGILQSKDGDRLLKVAFFITIPALVFVSAANIELSGELLLFPLLPVLLAVTSFLVARQLSGWFHLPKKQRGVFRAAPMVINSAFVLPFLLATFGEAGVTRVVLFNTLNNPMIFIFAYAVVASHNPQSTDLKSTFRKVLTSPPLWALILGLAWNLSNATLPPFLEAGLSGIGALTGTIIIIALGLLFKLVKSQVGSALVVVLLRSGLGLVVGLPVVVLLNLQGIDKTAALLLATAPVGFNMLTFSSLEKLDEAYTAQIVSYSVLVGLILAPILIFFTT